MSGVYETGWSYSESKRVSTILDPLPSVTVVEARSNELHYKQLTCAIDEI